MFYLNIDNNIEYLSNSDLHWIGTSEGQMDYPKYIGKKEAIEYFENAEGSMAFVGEIFDENFTSNKFKKELIVILGLNSIEEIKKVYKNKNKESFVIVLEPQPSFLTHVINSKNMSIFKNDDIALFVDNRLENIPLFLEPLFANLAIIGLAKNLRFYVTDYYRNYDSPIIQKTLEMFRQGVHSRIEVLGNSVEDSLQGFEQYLKNINWIAKSKNPMELKGKFKDIPAIVVAAGPSLNKNIEELKKTNGKVIIIAVDTIVQRLINEGIVPHFVCSIERISQVYDYFFKDKVYPKEITLVAPPLLDGRVFDSFNGELILPFRSEVSEFRWFQRLLEIEGDIGMQMGLSCANIAFGLANHLGCSPIIFTGQDLAYGETEGETHASGTTYDEIEIIKEKDTSNDDITEGYYGGKVKTTKIWLQFKLWFESQIQKNNIYAINATEGGARIFNTKQLSLKDTINQYCKQEIPDIYEEIKKLNNYKIDYSIVKKNLLKEKEYMMDLLDKCQIQHEDLRGLTITSETFLKNRIKFQNYFYRINYVKQQIVRNQLLLHDLQTLLVQYSWDSNSVDELISVENLEFERNVQLKLIIPVIVTLKKILREIDNTVEKIDSFIEA